MIIGRTAFLIVPVVGIVAILAGCAAPVAVSTPHPPVHSTNSATPTIKAAEKPGSRVPLDCADLFTPQTVAPLVGTTAQIIRDESTRPSDLSAVANAQLGTLGCEWGGGNQSEFGYPADLSIFIAPDSASDFTARYSGVLASLPASAGPTVANTAGDKSGYRCEAPTQSGDEAYCDGEMLVGSYWVTVGLSALAPATAASVGADMDKSLRSVAARLRAAGAPKTSEWVAPASPPPGFCSDSSSTATVRTIFGAPSLSPYPSGARTLDASRISLNGRDSSCTWTSPTAGTIDVELLAGGSWIFPTFAPVAPADSIIQGPYVSTAIPGTSAALLACSGDYSCEAYLAIGTTAADVYTNAGQAGSKTELAALAKAIASH